MGKLSLDFLLNPLTKYLFKISLISCHPLHSTVKRSESHCYFSEAKRVSDFHGFKTQLVKTGNIPTGEFRSSFCHYVQPSVSQFV